MREQRNRCTLPGQYLYWLDCSKNAAGSSGTTTPRAGTCLTRDRLGGRRRASRNKLSGVQDESHQPGKCPAEQQVASCLELIRCASVRSGSRTVLRRHEDGRKRNAHV